MSWCDRSVCSECGGIACELQQKIDELSAENAKLKDALKPVLECKYRKYHDGMIVWDGNPRCAVLKSQQIYKEGA